MTYELMHSAQAQSVRETEKCLFYLLVTIVATLQEMRINVGIFHPYFRVKSLRFELKVNIQLGKQ